MNILCYCCEAYTALTGKSGMDNAILTDSKFYIKDCEKAKSSTENINLLKCISNSKNLNCVSKPENVSNTTGRLQQKKINYSHVDLVSSKCQKYDDEDSGNDTSDKNLDSDSDVSCNKSDCSDNDSDSGVGRSYHKGQHNQSKVTNSVQNLAKDNINYDINGNIKKKSLTLKTDCFCSENPKSSLSEGNTTNSAVDSDTHSYINSETSLTQKTVVHKESSGTRFSDSDKATKHLVYAKATAEHVNECKVYLVHPSSKREHDTGLVIRTHLVKLSDMVIAKHYVNKVEKHSIAQQLKLCIGQQLLEIDNIPTKSMRTQHLQSHFKCIDISEEITLKVLQDKKIIKIIKANFKIDVTQENELSLVESSPEIHIKRIDHENENINKRKSKLCDVKNCSYCGIKGDIDYTESDDDIEPDELIEIVHQLSIELCSVMHNKSQMYFKTVNGQLVMDPLTKGDRSEQFKRKLFGGQRESGESVIVIWFRETYPDQTAYISATGQDKIGLVQPHKQGLVPIRQHATALNSEDPRLFYHRHVGTRYSCFTSTLFEGQYLAVVNDQVKLKKVDEKDISTDEDIHFIINYQTDVKTPAQSSPKENNVYQYETNL